MNSNRIQSADRSIHDWYRFVLSFPPHLVRKYLAAFSADPGRDVILDPFCGTGTTLVEAKKQGFRAFGVDANEMANFASHVKTFWNIDLESLEAELQSTLAEMLEINARKEAANTNGGTSDQELPSFISSVLGEDRSSIIPSGFISAKPLMKVLTAKQALKTVCGKSERDIMNLALADVIVRGAGNVRFGPEVYRTKPKQDAEVFDLFAKKMRCMLLDLQSLAHSTWPDTYVYSDDARDLNAIEDLSINIVITSPPYPNEKDYTRTTRLESVLLDLVQDKHQLRKMKQRLLRSNTRNVYQGDSDSEFISQFPRILNLASEIENRRITLGKTSGFERLYGKVVLHYFGGMYRHFQSLWRKLKPGGQCAYVVGDQMSYFRIPIETGALLAELATEIGYEVTGRDLWRTRKATATGIDLREEVLLLRKPD